MRENLDRTMAKFTADDYTTKLCRAVFSVVPFAPEFPFYANIDDAIRTVAATATPEQIARAKEIAKGEEMEKALWVVDALDTGDKGIAIYSGVKSAFGLFFSNSEKSPNRFETDPQQAADAGLKALGLAYVAAKIFPGSLQEKLAMFHRLPAGKALALWFAAVEVALPFTDNVIQAGGSAVQQLMSKVGDAQGSRITSLAGAGAAAEASGALQGMMKQLEEMTSKVVTYVGPMAERAKSHLPGVLNATDKIAGAVATGADVMPVWGLLGSRLVAEASAYRAIRGL